MFCGAAGVVLVDQPVDVAIDPDGATVNEPRDAGGPGRGQHLRGTDHIDPMKMCIGDVHLVLRGREMDDRVDTLQHALSGHQLVDGADLDLDARASQLFEIGRGGRRTHHACGKHVMPGGRRSEGESGADKPCAARYEQPHYSILTISLPGPNKRVYPFAL